MIFKLLLVVYSINIIIAVKNRKSATMKDHMRFILLGPVSLIVYIWCIVEEKVNR